MTTKFKRKNRFLSLLLALVLMFSMIPFMSMTASAAANGTVDGFSYNFRYGLCKYCNNHHSVKDVILSAITVSDGNVKFVFRISFSQYSSCYKPCNPSTYDSSNSDTNSFTYEITESFSCEKSFSYKDPSNKYLDFGTTKPQLCTVSITRSAGHNVSTWTYAGNGKHSGYCSLCKQTIPENCSGGTATCKDKAVCSKCSTAYGSVNTNNHSWGDWTTINGKHSRTCTTCMKTDSGNCSGGTATCTSKAVCSTCNTEYGSTDTNNHSWGEWVTENGKHTRTCKLNSNHIESGTCAGGKATCTSKAKCTVCSQEYGNVSGHSYQYTADGNVVTETCENNCGHKATATLKVDASKSLVYNGSTIKPLTVEYSDGWAGEKTAKITYADDCIAVGNHSGSVTIGGATANESFSISQAQNSWTTEPSISGWTYGETAKTPNKGTPKFGSDVKVEYKLATEDDSKYSTTVPTNAGSYKVRFSVEGNANYTALSKEVDLTIARKKIIVKAEDNSKTYGENDPTLTWKLTKGELVGTDALNGISVSRATGEDVKTYTITASQTNGANLNYDITFVDGTFTINKKTIGISWGNTTFTYDGTAKYPTATATGMVFNDEIGLTVTGSQVNAGAGYVATVTGITGEKAGNYQLPVDVTTTFNIEKAEQIAPSGLVGTPEDIDERANGTITGVTSAMEYRKNDETDYTVITGTELNNLADGIYYIRYEEDSNHNASPETKIVLSNDTKLKVTVPATQTGYTLTASNSTLKWNESTMLTFALKEGYSKLANFSVKVNGEPITLDNNGKYTVVNVQENITVTVEGVADITAPTAEITLRKNKWNQFFNSITFGLFFKDTQTVTITAEDKGSGVDKIYYYLSTTELTETQVQDLTDSDWTEYTGAFTLNPQDEYIIYAKAVDKDNNAKYISSEQGVVIDNIVPVISGIADGETHCGDTTFTVTDKHIDEVKVDGNKVTPTTDGKYTITADGKEHTIIATDKSGNASSEIKITVITIASLDDTIDGITTDNVKSSDKKAIEDIHSFVNGLIAGGKDFTDAEDTELANIKASTEALLNKIISVSAEMSNLDSSVKAYDINKVKSDDKDTINGLITRIDALLNGNNLTDNEKEAMTALKTTAQGLVKRIDDTASKIADLTGKVNAYDKDKVKSNDKDTINGLIDEMTALINGNNLNDTEKENLGNIRTTAENLIKKIDDTADEIKAITDSVNGYNKDTVKSDDKQDIENLITRIDTLTGTDNVTETEKSGLADVKEIADDLIGKIDETAKKVTDLTEDVNAYDKDKVTSKDKQDITDRIADIDKLLEEDNLNDSEKEELEKVKDTATALVDRIEEAKDSTETDNTDKVKDITSDNVKTEDKDDLEKAKDDLEKSLEDYKDNLTDDEKKEIQDEIGRIEDALEVIEKVEDVENLINKLPDTITKGDADAIKKADEAYNALSKYEQSILDKNAKKKLDNAKSALEALNKAANSPATGDSGHIWMWFALLFVSGGGLLSTTVYRRKKKYSVK